MRFLIKDLWNVLFPDRCPVCDTVLMQGESLICVQCLHALPFTDFSSLPGNEMEHAFSGRVRIQNATALLYFEKNNAAQILLHKLKYKGLQEVGEFLGNLLAEEIIRSDRFNDVEAIIPVPLHPEKLKKRGYNQLTWAGKALSANLNIPFLNDVLVRTGAAISQTHKNRLERAMLIDKAFQLKNVQKIKGKHILLIDDVLTTGATLESCCNVISETEGTQISLATLAYTPPKLL